MDRGCISNVALQKQITDLITAMGADCEIHLMKGSLVPGPDSTLAELMGAAPVGTWYTPKAATPGALMITNDGKYGFALACQNWAYTGTDPGETITAWFVASKATVTATIGPNVYIAGGVFKEQMPMNDPLNQARADIVLLWPPVTDQSL